ncbi:hypothetical protein PIB30_037165 [Stylosanthes scabra]|uniref:Major facilitator superfamily (MFS) profile domain-containing protein n=1 Tax=Stylosanthes scabra TaxID=79078 RepID=A0ABU6UDD7_9FABA|nr:hypothetical protein [Stylosanthes scabra]
MMRWESATVTLVMIYMVNIMDNADSSLLPAVYKEVGDTFQADPTALGTLTFYRSFVQCLCYPFAAYLAKRHNRAHLIALGAFLWAATTFSLAISTTFSQMAISRGLNGIGLAIFVPATKSLVADCTNDSNRGMAFGWLALTGNIGSILGGALAVILASTSFAGIPGWRIAFHLVALISVIAGVLVRLFANDPHYPNNKPKPMSFLSGMKDMLKEVKSVMRIPSFQVIVAQGVSGLIPWSAIFSFVTLWLELIGFSHKTTAFLWTMFIVAVSLAALFGGKMGDILSQHIPNSGRIIMAQISVGSAVPLAAILLLALPYDPSTPFLHALALFIMGFFMSWNGPATNNPILAEIIPEKSRSTIYAVDKFFESMLASFTAPVVGLMAQHIFGYKPIRKGQVSADRGNAAALAKALYTAIGIPMIISGSIYSFLYWTYPRDREQARIIAQLEMESSELQRLESIDLDDNDEQVLLPS